MKGRDCVWFQGGIGIVGARAHAHVCVCARERGGWEEGYSMCVAESINQKGSHLIYLFFTKQVRGQTRWTPYLPVATKSAIMDGCCAEFRRVKLRTEESVMLSICIKGVVVGSPRCSEWRAGYLCLQTMIGNRRVTLECLYGVCVVAKCGGTSSPVVWPQEINPRLHKEWRGMGQDLSNMKTLYPGTILPSGYKTTGVVLCVV